MGNEQVDFTKTNHSEFFPRPGRPPRSGPTSRSPNQREKIVNLLRERGPTGASNRELNSLCFRYGARIWELRRAGYDVVTIRDGNGLFRFVLRRGPIEPKRPAACGPRQAAPHTLSLFQGVP
jgi:hypothetical protein